MVNPFERAFGFQGFGFRLYGPRVSVLGRRASIMFVLSAKSKPSGFFSKISRTPAILQKSEACRCFRDFFWKSVEVSAYFLDCMSNVCFKLTSTTFSCNQCGSLLQESENPWPA